MSARLDHDENFSRTLAALGITDLIGDVRKDMRELRSGMLDLRGDLAQTRETVAKMQGRQEGENIRSDRRHRWRTYVVDVAAACGVILGAVATIHPF